MSLKNRVDPFGDLHSVGDRGIFTGNRECLVDDHGNIVHHHRGNLWITCVLQYADWRSPLAAPRHWTPLFFLDDAVALAGGHRPCGLCRRGEYNAYQSAVMRSLNLQNPLSAAELNIRLAGERLTRGRGQDRASDRKIWSQDISALPEGSVILGPDGQPTLVLDDRLMLFGFRGWTDPRPRLLKQEVSVLTPPTSVAALQHGFAPVLHPSARN